MKYLHAFLSIVLLLTFISCAGLTGRDSVMYRGYKSDNINTFLRGFEMAVESHERDLVLKYLEEDYLDEQLYDNLEGRTDQFMNELFWGYFYDIEDIKLLIFPTGFTNDIVNTDTLPFQVTFKDGTEKKIYLYIKKIRKRSREFAIFGAVG